MRARRVALSEREDLFELVEDEKGPQDLMPWAPKLDVATVKIFPERFFRERLGCFDARMGRRLRDGVLHLSDKIGFIRRIVEADIDGEHVLAAKKPEESGLKNRGLAEPRRREEDG